MIVDRQIFFKSQQKLQHIPYSQTEEWLEKCGYLDINCKFFIDNLDDPQIGFWGIVFKRKFIGEHLIVTGESYLDKITSKHIKNFFLEVINSNFAIIEISSTNFYDIKYEIGIRRAGFLRPLVSNLSHLTLVIKKQKERKTDKDWRRNLRKADKADLTFKHIEKPSINDLEIFCKLFLELKEKKDISYSLSSKSLFKLFKAENYKLFFVYDNKFNPIAGRIVYVSLGSSFDVHASNSNKARETGAAYYIIEMIILYLKEIGVDSFDYGMIPPSATKMDSIYVSKSYSGGSPTLYNSQWVFFKSKILEYIINGYFYLFKENSRY